MISGAARAVTNHADILATRERRQIVIKLFASISATKYFVYAVLYSAADSRQNYCQCFHTILGDTPRTSHSQILPVICEQWICQRVDDHERKTS
jgi:hypothetical protein